MSQPKDIIIPDNDNLTYSKVNIGTEVRIINARFYTMTVKGCVKWYITGNYQFDPDLPFTSSQIHNIKATINDELVIIDDDCTSIYVESMSKTKNTLSEIFRLGTMITNLANRTRFEAVCNLMIEVIESSE
jgi:hypothetical protein